jgi:type I restriction enzyme S subunit
MQLGDIASLSLGKMLDARKNRGTSQPYLANVNVRWGAFDLSDLREMRFEEDERERFSVRRGDIVMCEGGEPGRCAIWQSDEPIMFQKALHRIRACDGVDARFLYYSLLDVGGQDKFSVLFTGSTIKHLPKEKLRLLPVAIPAKAVQERIADCLSAYDDLFERNRRRMALLERAARELYQEWFVRLRFPGYEHAHTERGIPVGWREFPLRTITTKIGSGSTPRGGEASYTSEGVALIRSQNVYDYRFDVSGLAHLRQEQADALISASVEPNDTLVNITGASVARCCMVPLSVLPARVNQHVMIVRPNRELVDPHYLQKCLASDRHKRQLLSFAQKGSTREALTKEIMANYSILVPSREVMSVFGARLALFEEQRDALDRQNQHLLTARNLLLPRLMRGEMLT